MDRTRTTVLGDRIGFLESTPTVFLRHWNLSRDPFPSFGGTYVDTPPHEEAVARLFHAIRSRERFTVLHAEDGLGKTTVLARALSNARTTGLRIARSNAPINGTDLYYGLARSLRMRVSLGANKAELWRRLSDAARLIAAQRGLLLIVVDDASFSADSDDDRDLRRLSSLEGHPSLIISTRFAGEDYVDAFRVSLPRLNRTETADYLAAKLLASGGTTATFEPSAVARLHLYAMGIPSRVDRLAGLSLRAGAASRLESIPSGLVDVIGTDESTQGVMRTLRDG